LKNVGNHTADGGIF